MRVKRQYFLNTMFSDSSLFKNNIVPAQAAGQERISILHSGGSKVGVFVYLPPHVVAQYLSVEHMFSLCSLDVMQADIYLTLKLWERICFLLHLPPFRLS